MEEEEEEEEKEQEGGGWWWCVLVGMVENRERTDWCCSYQSFSISPIHTAQPQPALPHHTTTTTTTTIINPHIPIPTTRPRVTPNAPLPNQEIP